ncbi:RHS repeat-associated core domain-containing protein [Chryseobacterium camelliae]|uniref:RHS repeat-associated protein n=1 Tax=Chryseobacterium camelliae TaxID=1265445 RepID=A0ABU0TJF6_9FLAO|nr:SpvB/TcaC N-terminal domain-containing protein [Chryseobacterium camelliae]MDQ1097185.1 RHS repeat-associated protein [Chryseobacterium camelliae]
MKNIIQLSESDQTKGSFLIGENGIETSYKFPSESKSFKTFNADYYKAKDINISEGDELSIAYEGMNLNIEKGTSEAARIELLKLRSKDFPATSQGLKNVTLGNSAYRLSVVSGKLNKKVKLTMPYDEKRLGLVSPKDIKVFYFDYARKQWVIEKASAVDSKTKTVTVEGDGNTDYINGVISVPESPQLNAFAPTSISGLKAADPVAGVQLLSPPSPNQRGDASMSYPIVMPSGVHGMQPNLAISYNSSNGNGVMGEGWSISGVSGITLDTRWGTPGFDPNYETELYLLDGEMLVYEGGYLPHRHINGNGVLDVTRQARNTSGKKNFYLRKNNGFTRIERYGSSPTSYTWIITDTDGTKRYYGGDGMSVNNNAVVKTDQGQIVQWGITKEIDVHDNNIKYYYDNKILQAGQYPVTGDNLNLANGRQFHIERITYTGRNDNDGPYSVSFSYKDASRPDYSISAKEGVKRVETARLDNITVNYNDTSASLNGIVKNYTFSYQTGAFYKTLLQSIKGPGVNYQLEYHNDIGNALFSADQNVQAPTPDAFSGAVSSALTPSKISADHNFEWGWSLRAGIGFGLLRPHKTGDKNFMVSGFLGESYPDVKKGIELIDFNGDGITDILYRKRNGDNGLKIIPGSLDGNGNLQFTSAEQNILNLKSNFSRTTGSTFTTGGTVLFNWWKMGFDFTKSWSKSKSVTPVYLIDANSDGLPDIVKDNKVWFNHIKDNGQPEMVTTSDMTENMVLKGNVAVPYTEPEEDDDDDDGEEPVKAKNDVVKVWIAPKAGFIKISDQISMADPLKEATAVYSVEMKDPFNMPKNGRLFLTTLTGNSAPVSVYLEHYNDYPSTPLGISHSDRIAVKSGDKVYFRLHKKKGTNYVVNTTPKIQYVDNLGYNIGDSMEEEQDGFQPNALEYQQKFLLNNLTKTLKFSGSGTHSIEVPAFTVSQLRDDVTYQITLSKEDIVDPATDIKVLYTKTYGQTTGPVSIQDVSLNFNAPLGVPGGWHLKFSVLSDSYMNKELEWKNIKVNNGQTQTSAYDVAEYPSYYITDFKPKFHVSNLSNLPQGNNDYSISVNKNIGFSPSLSGNFTYIIKKNGLVVGKRKVGITNAGITETTISGSAINGLDPILFFTGDPYQSVQLQDKINILVFCNTPMDRAAYESLRAQLQDQVFNVYYGSSFQLAGSTSETSVNTGEFNGISAVYHNWGQFVYNEKKDVKQGQNPMSPPDPKDEPPTAPVASNGPDYTLNPDTPKDQYGALINSDFLDAPFSQFNYDYSSCSGITDQNEYTECVGDIIQNNFQNIANTNIMAGFNPIVPLITYYVKNGSASTEKWVNNLFTEQYSMAASFRDEESITPFFVNDDPDEPDTELQGDLNTEMYAIEKKQKSKAKTTNWGAGLTVISHSVSQLRGYGNINTQDFFDVNGDGYPDILYRDQAQLTNALGGLQPALGRNLENNGDSPISDNDSFQRTNTVAFSNTAVKTVGRMISNKDSDAKGDESTAWSGGLGYSDYPDSYEKGNKFWADINGDGLVDRVEKDGSDFKYKLNYGTGLVNNPYETYPGLDTNVSKPVGSVSASIGGGLSGLISQGTTFSSGWGVSGNVSASASSGTGKRTFQDINGDGLADLITVDNNGNTQVNYNMGNKFAPGTPLSKVGSLIDYGNESKTYNGALTLNGGFYVNAPMITIFGITLLYFRAGSDMSGTLGTSISEINKGLRDVNGDGYPDLVINNGNGLQVNYSRIGRTNKLAKVTELSTKGTFTIDYKFSAPTYNDPHSKWVMSEVKVLNPDVTSSTYTQATADKDRVTRFSYENSRYDRRERTVYGFEKVIAEEMNGSSVYRRSVQTFYNTTYFNSGLIRRSEVFPAGVLSNSSDHLYKMYNYSNNYSQITEIPSSQFETYDVGGKEGNRLAWILPVGGTQTTYENGVSLSTSTSMAYNNRGQLINYAYTSNVPAGNYSSAISYHNYSTLLNANILDVPAEIRVFDGSNNLIRQRNTQINQNNGDISQVNVALTSSGTTASTDLTYDTFGNIKTITYPTGYALTYDYDASGKYVLKVTDSFQVVSSATYDPKWDAVLEATDTGGSKIKYSYDAMGRITTVLGPKEAGVSQYTVQYSYFNSPITIGNTQPNLYGAVTQNYDPLHQNNPIETISLSDFTGKTVQVKKDIEMAGDEKMSVSGIVLYDALGRPVKQYHPTFENKDTAVNKSIKLTTAQYFTSRQYDALDRVIYDFDEDGNLTENQYAIDNGMFKHIILQMQNQSVQQRAETFANAEGRTVRTNNFIGNQALTTRYNYNGAGELTSVVDPENITTSYFYDLGGRRIREEHPDHGTNAYLYDAAGHLTGKTTSNLANSGMSQTYITYRYNGNRLMNINYPNLPDGSANPNNVTYQYGTSGFSTGRVARKSDGTGDTDYFYGNMGELIAERRTISGYNIPTVTFTTSYEYDSWNRLLSMRYADTESIQYSYDLGGNLKRMASNQFGDYISVIQYDEYGQRTKVMNGNGTYSSYIYNPSRRLLQNSILKKDNYAVFLDNNYEYDLVGNIVRIANGSTITPNQLGGGYDFSYRYDSLNRLTSSQGMVQKSIKDQHPDPNSINASFDLSMEYNATSGIVKKRQSVSNQGNTDPLNTYDNDYSYVSGTHKVGRITDQATGIDNQFKYDHNGNPGVDILPDSNKFMYWDEEDRMKAFYSDEAGVYQYYAYDDKGDRAIKYTLGEQAKLYQNGALVDGSMVLNAYSIYLNPFMVVTSDGKYTKHYYAGSERIASRLSDNSGQINKAADASSNGKSQDPEPDSEADFKHYAEKAGLDMRSIDTELKASAAQNGLYYLHGDHLGTATFVTDDNGEATQFFVNLPFGETLIEQQVAGKYSNPYKFNAKELDSETALYYYGARYYNPRLSIWYGVDPLAEKYPSWSPYAYTFNNPIIFTDPDGREPYKPTPKEAAAMAAHVYGDKKDNILIGGWRVSKKDFGITLENQKSGFKSQVYERVVNGKVTEYTYATAGTEDLAKDGLADVSQPLGASSQYSLSAKNATTLSNELGDMELSYTGHSLGGGLAALNSNLTRREAITFNAAGVGIATKYLNGQNNSDMKGWFGGFTAAFRTEGKIDAYIMTTDPLNNIQDNNYLMPNVNGKRHYILPTTKGSFYNGHSMDNILKEFGISPDKYKK